MERFESLLVLCNPKQEGNDATDSIKTTEEDKEIDIATASLLLLAWFGFSGRFSRTGRHFYIKIGTRRNSEGFFFLVGKDVSSGFGKSWTVQHTATRHRGAVMCVLVTPMESFLPLLSQMAERRKKNVHPIAFQALSKPFQTALVQMDMWNIFAKTFHLARPVLDAVFFLADQISAFARLFNLLKKKTTEDEKSSQRNRTAFYCIVHFIAANIYIY